MKKLVLLSILFITSPLLYSMQNSKEEYFDSLSYEENALVGWSCGPLLKARHIPTGNMVAAYFPIGGMGWCYQGYVFKSNNSKNGYDLDPNNSKIAFESIQKAYKETDASKKNSILADLHKLITELEAKK